MKRSDALTPLSRDHHQGLFVAHRLTRATEETRTEACAGFLAFWRTDGGLHFRAEEEILLPAYARHGSSEHEAVVRVLIEHVELRRLAADLEADTAPGLELLHSVGKRLHDHIRHEERVLFPLIEEALPESALSELAVALERAERGCPCASSSPS